MGDALVGAIIGGIFALGGSFGALLVQDRLRERGRITRQVRDCDITMITKAAGEVRSFQSLKSLQEEDLDDVDELHLNAVLRLHNEKDVSVGLMEMHIALQGQQQELRCTPDARIRYMGLQEEQKEEPFQAATLPAQQVVIMWLEAVVTEKAILEKLVKCDRAELLAHLSNGDVIKEEMLVGSSSR